METTNQGTERPSGEWGLKEESASSLRHSVTSSLDFKRPFLEHLEEFRRRLFRSFFWIALGTGLCLRWSPKILSWLIRPVGRVVFLSPAEPFMVHLKIAFLGGVILAVPFLAWEIWGFLRPAFRAREGKLFFLLVPMSAALFVSGVWFGWAVLLPVALKFFLQFSSEALTPMLTLGEYIGFTGWMLLASGLLFQMPVVVLLLTWTGLVGPQVLCKQWRVAVVAILCVSAVLTPTPDVATQLLLAPPMAILYGVSVGLALIIPRRRESMG